MGLNDLTIKNNLFIAPTDTLQTTTPVAPTTKAALPIVPAKPAATLVSTAPKVTPTTPPVQTTTTKPIQLVDKRKIEANKMVGLEVHKTKTTQTTTPKNIHETEKTKTGAHKSKRTLNQIMRVSFSDWDKLSKTEKEKKVLGTLTTVPKEKFNYLATKSQPDGRIGWLKSVLLNDKMTPEESKLAVGVLKHLNANKADFAELQAQGVKMAFDDDNINSESCQLQITQDMGAYGVKGQRMAIDKSSTSKFDSVKIEGSKHSSKVKAELQDYAVDKYIQGAKTSSEKVQSTIGHIIVDQYADFAKEKQVKVHEIVSTKSSSDVVTYAASNIWHFDKANQAQAVQITANTGNEKAINAAAAQYDKYDQSTRTQIKETINNSGCDSAKDTLKNAEIKAEEKAKVEAETKTETKTTASEQTTSNELKKIMNSNEPNKNTLIKEAFKHNPQQAAAWVETLNPYELANIIDAIPLSDLPPDVQNKVSKAMEHADKSSQKRYFEKLNATLMADATIMESCGDNLQKLYTENCLAKGKKLQSTYMLSLGVKRDYDAELKKQDKSTNQNYNEKLKGQNIG